MSSSTVPTPAAPEALRLDYAATTDVGPVRKDNQDSGYAGPWLLAICDGVGGAARGDIASSTAIAQIRRIDEEPKVESSDDLLGLVSNAIMRASMRIGELVDADPALSGTSTTATVALFDGTQLAMGHVGDSRAYLYRDGEITRLTHDHTFVQTLVDEGRISEDESRVHPHRNLVLKAVDGQRDTEPDLFLVPLQPGDRIMVCSDGVTGWLTDQRLADILGTGSPDYAATELTRASLVAGATDNVTCVVADVVPATRATGQAEPLLVGAAADHKRRHNTRSTATTRQGFRPRFRGHRGGDTGELPPVPGDTDGDSEFEVPAAAFADDPVDPESLRYALKAPRQRIWWRRVILAALVIGVVWAVAAAGWWWTQRQWFVGEEDGDVAIFRGVHSTILGFDLASTYETTDLPLEELPDAYAEQVRDGIHRSSLSDAQTKVNELLCDAAAADTGSSATGAGC